jgi:serine/threonine protein kinase
MKVIAGRFVLSDAEPRRGGMAEVHRAADTQQGLRPVAVKFMVNTRLRDDRIVREAFGRELAALNALDHPNIVKIIDFDPRHDPPYLVLEWLEQDLISCLDSAPTHEWNEFYARFGRPVLGALVYALTKRVVHRDLKPGNVLVDDHGIVKIADFGISKLGLASLPAGGPTLAAFKSEPYAPLEDGVAAESRDAYSFAVLALRCVAGREFLSHEDVATALASFAGPTSVRDVLSRAIAAEPTSRFANVLELQTALESFRASTRASQGTTTTCYFFALPQAVARLCERIGNNDERRVQRLLERDIAESLVLFFWRDRETGEKIEHQFLGRTSQFRLHLGVNNKSRDQLVVLSAWPDESDEHEAHSGFGFKPAVAIAFGRPPPTVDAVADIKWLVEALTQHELDAADARRERQGEELLREWAATLRFRQSVEDGRYAAIPYNEYRVDGNRVYFAVRSLPDGVFLDQPRMVRWDQRTAVAGVIDEIGPGFVSLWVEHGVPGQLPGEGQLVIDNRASRIAIDRQKGALDAIRYRRCLRPNLRELILDPSGAKAPKDVGELAWAHGEFDEDKKRAVKSALGASDILVVQGPPGTGKTRFITELVVQVLRRTPDAKILLTSQTHVALDPQ